jgi:hypothetical protein
MNSPDAKLQFITPSYTVDTPKEIIDQIEKLRREIVDTVGNMGSAALTTPLVLCKQTDIMYLISRLNATSAEKIILEAERLVKHSDKLVRFTLWLVLLTWASVFLAVVLLAVGIIQIKIMLRQDDAAHTQHVHASQNYSAISTNR